MDWQKDFVQITEGAFAFAARTEVADLMLEDPRNFMSVLHETVSHPDVTVLVYTEDDVVTAALGFSCQPFHWAPQALTTQELFFFNLSGGPHAALALLRAYEREARSQGAKILNLTHLETSDPRVGAVYRRMGARPAEHTYMKEL